MFGLVHPRPALGALSCIKTRDRRSSIKRRDRDPQRLSPLACFIKPCSSPSWLSLPTARSSNRKKRGRPPSENAVFSVASPLCKHLELQLGVRLVACRSKAERSDGAPETSAWPQSKYWPKRRRKQTLSCAVAASVVDVAQTLELATVLAGQIARTAAIFNIDEVVVIDDSEHTGYAAGPAGCNSTQRL